MRQPFSKGFFVGGAMASAMTVTKGLFPGGKWKYEPDTEIEMSDGGAAKDYPKPDSKLTFNKLDSVFLSGNATRDDAPNHVKIQSRSRASWRRPGSTSARRRSTRSPRTSSRTAPPTVDVHVTASNCVQCGAINAKGGRLTMPEGGDGPLYQEV